MRYWFKQFLSRILVLLIIISPMQVSSAADFDHDDHSQSCSVEISHEQHPHDTSSKDDCSKQHSEHCSDHPECVAQHSQSPLHTSSTGLLVSPAISQLKFIPSHDSILTVYSSPLKRPPKS